MSRELAKTIAESFKSFRSELEIEYEDERPVESDKAADEDTRTLNPQRRREVLKRLIARQT
jgi:Sec-independent protein translocase protein TatA